MRSAVVAVRRDIHLDDVIILQMEILFCGQTHRCIFQQHHDSVMRRADTNLILCANHSQRFLTANLAAFDGEVLIAGIEYCADRSHNHFLSGSHIRRTANDLYRLFVRRDTSGRDMQMVRVRVLNTCHHFAHYQAFQTAFDCLYFLYCSHLQTDGSEDLRYLFCIVFQGDVTL